MSAMAVPKERRFGAVLKAVIIYDDFDSATRATALLERAALRASEGMKLDIKPWRCDVLKQPALAALTVAVAANADLIVFALNRIQSQTTELVLAWLNNWAAHRRIEDAAIVALYKETNHSKSKFWVKIRNFSETHNLSFLGDHDIRHDGSSLEPVQRLPPQKQADVPASRPAFAERSPVPHHWGVNE
jgi:hypothetical protein